MGAVTEKTKVRGVYRRPDGSLILDRTIKGVRISGSLGPIKLADAEKELTRRIAAVHDGTYQIDRHSLTLTVTDALSTYWRDTLQHKARAANAKYLLSTIADILGNRPVSSLTVADAVRYEERRLRDTTKHGRPVSPRTIKDELVLLSSALNWCAMDGIIPQNPIRGYRMRAKVRPSRIVMDQGYDQGEEWQRIADNALHDNRLLYLILYEAGLRPKEAMHMRRSWLVFLRGGQCKIAVPLDLEKTGAEREVPVSPTLLEALQPVLSTLDEEGLVCPSPVTGKPRTNMLRGWNATVRRAGLSGRRYTPYVLRRTRLTIWDEIDPVAAKYAGGHVLEEAHYKHYVRMTDRRLFRLVGVDVQPSLRLVSKKVG